MIGVNSGDGARRLPRTWSAFAQHERSVFRFDPELRRAIRGTTAVLPMNLGGVRVPSNPDLFWRSSMSGLDGFRLGDYSSERVSPHRSRAQRA